MILSEKEAEQFDRVLEIVTYGEDNKPQFTPEAIGLLDELAENFKRVKEKVLDKHPEPDWIEEETAADCYTYLLLKINGASMGLLMEMVIILWVPIIADKLKKERELKSL